MLGEIFGILWILLNVSVSADEEAFLNITTALIATQSTMAYTHKRSFLTLTLTSK